MIMMMNGENDDNDENDNDDNDNDDNDNDDNANLVSDALEEALAVAEALGGETNPLPGARAG